MTRPTQVEIDQMARDALRDGMSAVVERVRVSQPPGLRNMVLSDDDAEELERIIANPPTGPKRIARPVRHRILPDAREEPQTYSLGIEQGINRYSGLQQMGTEWHPVSDQRAAQIGFSEWRVSTVPTYPWETADDPLDCFYRRPLRSAQRINTP